MRVDPIIAGRSARSGRALAIVGGLSAALMVVALALLAFGWSGEVRASSPSLAPVVVAAPARLVERRPPPVHVVPETAAHRSGTSRRPALGSLMVDTPGTTAEVFVGGLYVGHSPMALTLPAGPRTIRLVPDDARAAIERTVTLESSQTTSLVVRFARP